MKERSIEEKLEKLGIERRSDSSLSGPHGRAASVSTGMVSVPDSCSEKRRFHHLQTLLYFCSSSTNCNSSRAVPTRLLHRLIRSLRPHLRILCSSSAYMGMDMPCHSLREALIIHHYLELVGA
jgi:hypothetical protein